MSHHPSDPLYRRDDKWLEKSLVAPSPSLLYERSDGEKAASEQLIHEKAVSERWNRGISKVLFSLRLLIIVIPLALAAGIMIGLSLSP